MSLSSLCALKRMLLTVGTLSLCALSTLPAHAQSSWPPTAASGDNLSAGTYQSHGHHYIVEYIGTDTTAGNTDPANFSRPTVSVTAGITGMVTSIINDENITYDVMNNTITDYFIDSSPNYVGGSYYYGPISSYNNDTYGQGNVWACSYGLERAVDMKLNSTSFGYGSIVMQANHPFFVYKITCTDAPNSGTTNFGLILTVAQGYDCYVHYSPFFNVDSYSFGAATTAGGESAGYPTFTFTHDPSHSAWDPVYNVNVGNPGPNALQRTADQDFSVVMVGMGSNSAVGYAWVSIDPYIYAEDGGDPYAPFNAGAAWHVLPFAIDGP